MIIVTHREMEGEGVMPPHVMGAGGNIDRREEERGDDTGKLRLGSANSGEG